MLSYALHVWHGVCGGSIVYGTIGGRCLYGKETSTEVEAEEHRFLEGVCLCLVRVSLKRICLNVVL